MIKDLHFLRNIQDCSKTFSKMTKKYKNICQHLCGSSFPIGAQTILFLLPIIVVTIGGGPNAGLHIQHRQIAFPAVMAAFFRTFAPFLLGQCAQKGQSNWRQFWRLAFFRGRPGFVALNGIGDIIPGKIFDDENGNLCIIVE